MTGDGSLVQVRDLVKRFPAASGRSLRAVDGVTFDIAHGETLGLVGESGCGKSTLGRCLCRLEEPTGGRVIFDGVEITGLSAAQLRPHRPRLQMIFQDPFASLNPHKTVEQLIGLPLRIKGFGSAGAVRRRVAELMQLVGLDVAQARRFPHQFSGGQRQRIGIARALASEPALIIADEPVASLDVSIQAQILEILRSLQERFRLAVLFISHDISVVSYVSRRIAVMYLGKIVEIGPVRPVIEAPLHPYTRALVAAVPRIESGGAGSPLRLSGDVPSPTAVPPGCRFHTRCYLDQVPQCRTTEPALRTLGPAHEFACHLARPADRA